MSFNYASRGMSGASACYASRGLACVLAPTAIIPTTEVAAGGLAFMSAASLAAVVSENELTVADAFGRARAHGGGNTATKTGGRLRLSGGSKVEM